MPVRNIVSVRSNNDQVKVRVESLEGTALNVMKNKQGVTIIHSGGLIINVRYATPSGYVPTKTGGAHEAAPTALQGGVPPTGTMTTALQPLAPTLAPTLAPAPYAATTTASPAPGSDALATVAAMPAMLQAGIGTSASQQQCAELPAPIPSATATATASDVLMGGMGTTASQQQQQPTATTASSSADVHMSDMGTDASAFPRQEQKQTIDMRMYRAALIEAEFDDVCEELDDAVEKPDTLREEHTTLREEHKALRKEHEFIQWYADLLESVLRVDEESGGVAGGPQVAENGGGDGVGGGGAQLFDPYGVFNPEAGPSGT